MKHIWILLILLLAVLAAVLFFCAQPSSQKTEVPVPEEVVAVRYTQVHMERHRSFTFVLTQGKQTTLDARMHDGDGQKISLTGKVVASEYFTQFREFLQQHQVISQMLDQPGAPRFAADQTACTLELRCTDGHILKSSRLFDFSPELEQFFREMAENNT